MEFCGKGIIIDQIVATDTGDVNVNKEAGDIDERISLEPLADDPSLVSESAVDIQTPAAAPLNRAAVSPRVRPCDVTKPDSTLRRPRPSLPPIHTSPVSTVKRPAGKAHSPLVVRRSNRERKPVDKLGL